MSTSRLSALDAAFLAIESDDAPMHVGWAALFAPPVLGAAPRFEAVRDHIERRLHRAPRYRQRLAEVPLGLDDPVWTDDAHFDISATCATPSIGTSARSSTRSCRSRCATTARCGSCGSPTGCRDGRIGVVGKAHHCLVDGLAAVELMALLLDVTPEPEAAPGATAGCRVRCRAR